MLSVEELDDMIARLVRERDNLSRRMRKVKYTDREKYTKLKIQKDAVFSVIERLRGICVMKEHSWYV